MQKIRQFSIEIDRCETGETEHQYTEKVTDVSALIRGLTDGDDMVIHCTVQTVPDGTRVL